MGFLVGTLFGFGLMFSGMLRRTKVYGFFTLKENWDPSLGFVMGGALGFNMFTFNYLMKNKQKPILN